MKQNPFSEQLEHYKIDEQKGMSCNFDDDELFKKTIFGENREECLNWLKDSSKEGVYFENKPRNLSFLTDREKQFFMAGLGTPTKKGVAVDKFHIMASFQ